MADNLSSTTKHFVGGEDPDKEMIKLMQSILESKPLSGDDIQSLPDAQKELKRIRKLMDTYKKSRAINNSATSTSNKEKKHGRQTIHEEENSNDYVKKVIDKDKIVRLLIYDAIKTNLLFESNTEDELMEIIDIFEPCSFKASDVVIQQDEIDDYFYVVESGELSITVRVATDDEEDETLTDKSVNEVKVGDYRQKGSAFGELALIYGSPRAATIAATTDCQLWRIRRSWYRGVVAQHHKRLHMEKVMFLSNVKVGKKTFGEVFAKDQLDTMAQLLKQEYFHKGETIVREGEAGNTFYIIQSGEVDIYKKGLGENGAPIGTIGKGKYFGEKALLSDDVRQATVVASTEEVVCYVMTRSEFTRMIGNLQDILDGKDSKKAVTFSTNVKKSRVTLKLEDLEVKNVLAEGGFGKVELAKDKESGEYYALKAHENKQFVLDQKTYIMTELKLMYKLNHPNVLMLHCDMQDKKYIYFLLDLLPGGTVMTLLERKGKLSEDWGFKAREYVLGCHGYCMIGGLGLAKQLDDGPTYTFCGTLDYMAPELIRGIGYNWAVDYWSLGVLLYELHSGKAPFKSHNSAHSVRRILKGLLSFPSDFSPQIQTIIKDLLTKDPTRRLGCMSEATMGVIQHRFYNGFDWKGLLNKRIPTPYTPRLPNGLDSIGYEDADKKWTPDLPNESSDKTRAMSIEEEGSESDLPIALDPNERGDGSTYLDVLKSTAQESKGYYGITTSEQFQEMDAREMSRMRTEEE